MENELIRLNKYLAGSGICSRREADRMIEEGRVTIGCEDGTVRKASVGERIREGAAVYVDGKPVRTDENEKLYMMLNKPKGIVCTGDRRVKENIIDFAGLRHYISYAGRLDKDSTGLVLLTSDGDLNDKIMRASNYHEKEYRVRVDKKITPKFLKAMSEGVRIELTDDRHLTGELRPDGKPKGLVVKTRPCFVRQEGKNVFTIILTQGYNRQIRRMCAACGYTVLEIRRVRIMNLRLGNLKEGMKRFLTKEEIRTLKEMAEERGSDG